MGSMILAVVLVAVLMATAIVALELGVRLILLLAWTVAQACGHRRAAELFRLTLEAREGSHAARTALHQL